MTAEELIARLQLVPHPKEGGFFRETYRSRANIQPTGYPSPRSVSTAIYYLLTPTTFSALHRLSSDEIFHFYLGDPVQMLQLMPDGDSRVVTLGTDVRAGQEMQTVVPAGVWQGSRLLPGGSFALLGCTVAPGFDYADYEHGEREDLVSRYPACSELIRELT